MHRKMDFDTWGFHNHIIEYRLKVRMTEDLIDCAQRLALKSDDKTQRELYLLTLMRDRLYDDLRYFIAKRDTKPWRNWDKAGVYYKPTLDSKNLTLSQVQYRIDLNMLMIAYIEPRYVQLMREIPPYNVINSEMIQFCTLTFGNEGWLHLFQLKMLRKQQEQEQHKKQYMPPVDHIKKLEVDPYTLQVDEKVLVRDQQATLDGEEPLIEDRSKKQLKSAWQIKKPEKQPKLVTGYEQIMARKKSTEESQPSERDSEAGIKSGSILFKPADGEDREGDSVAQTNAITGSEGHGASIIRQTEGNQTMSGMQLNTKFEGEDVVQHLKDLATLGEKQEQDQLEAEQIAKSGWLETIEREKAQRAEKEVAERKARAARLAILFEDEDVLSQDDEDMLDAGAAKHVVTNFMDKIDTHLKVEKRLLEAWHEKDESLGIVAKEGPAGKKEGETTLPESNKGAK